MSTATIDAPLVSQSRATQPPPTDAILSLDQVAPLLGKTLKGVRHLTKVGLLKHQLIDGERCVWLSLKFVRTPNVRLLVLDTSVNESCFLEREKRRVLDVA